jgi:ribosomal 50S subunit-associated protein YjgA (DUF615 family)
MTTKKRLPPEKGEAPSFTDYNNRIVTITPLRMELSQLQKDGLDAIPLGELLRIIARVIKENQSGTI